MTARVYLDWNATTPLRPEARRAMAAAWDLTGNPSSVHAEGRQTRRLVEEARAAVGAAIGALPRNVLFTSSGTEANALALAPGLRNGASGPVQRLLVSAVEHVSVLAGGRFAPEAITRIAVTRSGVIDLDDLRRQVSIGRACQGLRQQSADGHIIVAHPLLLIHHSAFIILPLLLADPLQ